MNRRQIFQTLGISAVGAWGLKASVLLAANSDRFRVPEWGLHRRYHQGGFGRVSYLDEGRGDPVLFLHGYPLSGFQWRHSFERLALTNRCIVPDFLGLGASEAAVGQDLSAWSQMQMILSLLDALQITHAHVIANDSGGVVGQLLAAHHADRVRTLILTNGDTERQSPPQAMHSVIALAREKLYVKQWIEPWYENRERARQPNQFGGMCYTDASNPTNEAIEMYFGPLLSSPERARQVEAHAIAQSQNALAGITPLLRRSSVPTRIIWGTGDTIFDASNAEFLDHSFGNSKGIRRLDGAKLFWPEERPSIIVDEAYALWRGGKG